MTVEPFQPFHVDLLIAQGVQPHQQAEASLVPGSYASLPRVAGQALTVFRDDGRVMLCGGVIPQAPGIGTLWALLSKDAGKHMLFLTRATRRFIGTQNYRRIEVTAESQWQTGCRWLQLLGFGYEGPCYGYGPNGEDHGRWSLVRK